jgi:hypothetical protein
LKRTNPTESRMNHLGYIQCRTCAALLPVVQSLWTQSWTSLLSEHILHAIARWCFCYTSIPHAMLSPPTQVLFYLAIKRVLARYYAMLLEASMESRQDSHQRAVSRAQAALAADGEPGAPVRVWEEMSMESDTDGEGDVEVLVLGYVPFTSQR